jgi:hypothetical protein
MRTPQELQSIADCINTGAENPDTSRALVVFNLTEQTLSGTAVFRASMSWPNGVPLPPVTVTDWAGQRVPSVIREMSEGPDAKGRLTHCQLTFSLQFSVAIIPPNSWHTYIAAYAERPGDPSAEYPSAEIADLMVLETTRHSGDLPPVDQAQLPRLKTGDDA